MNFIFFVRIAVSLALCYCSYYLSWELGWIDNTNAIIAIIYVFLNVVLTSWYEKSTDDGDVATEYSIWGLAISIITQVVINLLSAVWFRIIFMIVVFGGILFALYEKEKIQGKVKKNVINSIAKKLNGNFNLQLEGKLKKMPINEKPNLDRLKPFTIELSAKMRAIEDEKKRLVDELNRTDKKIEAQVKKKIEENQKKIDDELRLEKMKMAGKINGHDMIKLQYEKEKESLQKKLDSLGGVEENRRTNQRVKYEKKLREIQLDFAKKLSIMEKELGDKLNKTTDDLMKSVQERFKKAIKKEKESLLDSIFSEHEEGYTKSKVFEDEMLERERDKKRQELWEMEETLKRQKFEFEIKEESAKQYDLHKEMNEKLKESVDQNEKESKQKFDNIDKQFFEQEKAMFDLKSRLVDSINKLEIRLEKEVLQLRQVFSDLKTQFQERLNQITLRIGQEILRIDSNHMNLVHKVGEFINEYEGDKREFNQQLEGQKMYIDQVAFDAFQNYRTLEGRLDSEVLQLDRKHMETGGLLESIQNRFEKELLLADVSSKSRVDELKNNFVRYDAELQVKINDLSYESKISKNDMVHLIESKGYKYEDLLNKNVSQLAREIDHVKADDRLKWSETNYEFDQKLNGIDNRSNISFKELHHLMEVKGYRLEDLMNKNNRVLENEIKEVKTSQDRKWMETNFKLDKDLASLAHSTSASVTELKYLMEVKGYKYEQLLNKSIHEIKDELRELNASQKIKWAESEKNFAIRMKDFETLLYRELANQDKKILQIVTKLENFQNQIDGHQNKIEGLKLEIQKSGLENNAVRQEAKLILGEVESRLKLIDNEFNMVFQKMKLSEERLKNGVTDGMLRLRQITMDQEYNLKQIAFGEKGWELMYQEASNRIQEKQNNLNRIADQISSNKKEMEYKLTSRDQMERLAKKNDTLRWEQQRTDQMLSMESKRRSQAEAELRRKKRY